MPDPQPIRPPPGRRADYVRFVPISLRWLDNDAFGHVNNAHYYSFIDTAVTEAMTGAGVLASGEEHSIMVVVESGCRYHREIAFPGRIDVGVRLARLGSSSVRFEAAVFTEGAELASAEGFMVHVCVARDGRRPMPLPDAWRAALTSLSGQP